MKQRKLKIKRPGREGAGDTDTRKKEKKRYRKKYE